MTNASPIRRYVLLRHRDHSSPVPQWSMERIAATPKAQPPAPRAVQQPGPKGPRA